MRTRQTKRKIIELPGRCYTGQGTPQDVILKDLSVGGCRFETQSVKLGLGSRLQIYIAGTGPHHASVTWVEKGEVGITFRTPLSEEKFEGFQSSHVPVYSQSSGGAFDAMPEDQSTRRFC